MPEFEITVKGYKPQLCEVKLTIEADDQADAEIEALAQAQHGSLYNIPIRILDASSDIVWEEAGLAEDDE